MGTRNFTESTVKMTIQYLKDNLPGILSSLRTERDDSYVTTEPPKDYFYYARSHAYKTPAVFVIADNGDLQKDAGPNAIMANIRVNISVVVEDRDQDHLTVKAWRYQDALFEALDETQIVSTDKKIKIVIVPKTFSFSPAFTMNNDARASVNTFRKEVLLECDVHHFEQP